MGPSALIVYSSRRPRMRKTRQAIGMRNIASTMLTVEVTISLTTCTHKITSGDGKFMSSYLPCRQSAEGVPQPLERADYLVEAPETGLRSAILPMRV